MKLAICVYVRDNSSKVSPDLASSHYFLIYDLNRKILIENIKNHFRTSIGAEIFCAQLLIKKGINIIVCNECEDDAKKLFSEANIQIIENINMNPALFLEEFYKKYHSDKPVSEYLIG